MDVNITLEQQELLKEAANVLNDIWEKIKAAINKFMEDMKEFAKILCRVPGYKRMARVNELNYYKSISKGKSNNWRKMHGLSLVRRR